MHEEFVDFPGALTTFLDSPHNERLTAMAITRSENTFYVGRVAVFWCLDVAASVSLETEALSTVIWTQETHTQENEVRREKFLRIENLRVGPLTLLVLLPIKTNGLC